MDEAEVVPAEDEELETAGPAGAGVGDDAAPGDAPALDGATADVAATGAGSAADEPREGSAPDSAEAAEPVEVSDETPALAPSLDEMLGQLAADQGVDEKAHPEEPAEEAVAETAAETAACPETPSEASQGSGEDAEAVAPAEEAEGETAEEVPTGETEAGETAEEVPAEETEGAETAEENEPSETEPPVSEPKEPKPITLRWWTRVPLWVLFGAFLVVVGTVSYLLWPLAAGQFTTSDLYPLLVFGGAGLVLIDLVTGLVIWLLARSRANDDEKAGLGRTLWMRCLAWTAGGVAIWWIGLILLDLRHIGLVG
jgi:hypothetical protein